MEQNQSNNGGKEAISTDALFDKQKAKVNIIAEIFNDKELFLKDVRIKKVLSKKLNDEGFAWLRRRIDELRMIHKMVSY